MGGEGKGGLGGDECYRLEGEEAGVACWQLLLLLLLPLLQVKTEYGYSANLHNLHPLNQTENWSGLSGNTSLGSLKVDMSTSYHQDQHSHHREAGQEREEEFQWMEAGEENLNEAGRDKSYHGVGRQLGEEDWAGEGERGERLLNRMLPTNTDPWVEEQEGLSYTSSQYLSESFRGEGEWTGGGEREEGAGEEKV